MEHARSDHADVALAQLLRLLLDEVLTAADEHEHYLEKLVRVIRVRRESRVPLEHDVTPRVVPVIDVFIVTPVKSLLGERAGHSVQPRDLERSVLHHVFTQLISLHHAAPFLFPPFTLYIIHHMSK